ncbi:MAG: hypothetical protein COA45_08280 [Zetaproteobacteria bacterium]|nr:MAG: hypothetical protein COA45_08280 [Zetaproteobacteria bacterium]
MGEKINLSGNFREQSVDGFANFYDGSLKAQDNPNFLAAYKDLLVKNDRVLYLDQHLQVEGKEFMASDQHMRMLEDAGYEFHLIEYDPSLNPVIESYERGEIQIEDVRQALVDFQMDASRDEVENMISSGLVTKKEIEESFDKSLSPFVDAIENAYAHNIKVRFFDDATVIGNDLNENDENAHIDNPLFRRDDTWDPYIEALTKGAKASMFIGGGHVASSYGIDEYMEARGYNVGTFSISAEVSDKGISAENNGMVNSFEKMLARDPDGFDRSDFVVDLLYHDTAKTVEWQKMMAEDTKWRELENNIEQAVEPKSEPDEEVVLLSLDAPLKL